MGRKTIFSEEQIKDIIDRYQNGGESTVKIAQIYNVSHQTIGRLLKKNNIKPSIRKHHFNEEIFNKIDTAEKAYWIGFIAADGYINEQRAFMRIKLQECDLEHLKKFVKFIDGDDGMIKHEYHNITENKQYYVEVNSRIFINSLVKLNLRQAKSSGKEQLSPIPEKYIRDYIRGLWDGDGHIEERSIDLISSIEILEFVQNHLYETCNININRILEHCNTYRIYVCKNRYNVLDYLYYDNCISLDRKYNLIKVLKTIKNEKKLLKEKIKQEYNANLENIMCRLK